MKFEELEAFYKGKRVFLTGHTGFKGAWLTKILLMAGAKVTGYALNPPTKPNLFTELGLEKEAGLRSVIGDIRDYEWLKKNFEDTDPEIVFHLAAQPIVLTSYEMPRETYEINVMGTVNLLECIRQSQNVKSVLNVTTDKVYENIEDPDHGYVEEDKLDGYDPYSNSKSCSELVTHSYMKSFLSDRCSVSTARAGNVIGGGDFADNRIIPDCARAMEKKEEIVVRNPYSVRPYQHVLEPLSIYLDIVRSQAENRELAGYYNVGPDEEDCLNTGTLVDLFCKHWGAGASWKNVSRKDAPHEASYLKLDCNKIKKVFGWQPVWGIDEAILRTVEWYRTRIEGGDIPLLTEQQIRAFFR